MKHIKSVLSKAPGAAFSPWALWTWNRTVTRLEVENQVNALIAAGFGGIAVRPGRDMSPFYLSQEFFDCFRLVLEIAGKNKIGVRLADDLSLVWDGCLDDSVANRSAAQRADYLVLEYDVEAQGSQEVVIPLELDCEYIAQVIKKPAKAAQTVDVKQIAIPANTLSYRWKPTSTDWRLIVYKKEAAVAPSGENVPNPLNTKTLQNYMQNSLEALKAGISEFVPSVFEGIITEVPALRPGANAIYWDEDISVKYKSRYKREFMPLLPYLFVDLPGAERVRSQLHRFIYDLIVERFVVPLDGWAKKYRLSQWVLWPETGIYKPEFAIADGYLPTEDALATVGFQNIDGGVENFALMRIAADTNSNQLRRETITVVGRNRTASSYSPQEFKREIDMALLSGPSIVLIDGFYLNAEPRNCYKTPNNTFYQAPDWETVKNLCAYSGRARELLVTLQRSREVAVLGPTDYLMGSYSPHNPHTASSGLARFKKSVEILSTRGINIDIVNENHLLNCLVRQDGTFATNDRQRKGNYQALVIPYAPLLSRRLLVYLENLAIKGTPLIFIDEAPQGTFEDGNIQSVLSRIEKMVSSRRGNVSVLLTSELDRALADDIMSPEVAVSRESGEITNIFVQTYNGESGRLHVLHNSLESTEQSVIIEMPIEKYFTAIDCVSGDAIEIEPFDTDRGKARLRVSFSPLQTIILAATSVKIAGPHDPKAWDPFVLPQRSYRIIFKDQWDFEAISPNVLPLSGWTVRMGQSRESGQISHYYETTFDVRELPGKCMFVLHGMSLGRAPMQNVEVSFNGIKVDCIPPEEMFFDDSLPVTLFGYAPRFDIGDKIIKGHNRVSIRTSGTAVAPSTLVYPPVIVGHFAVAKGSHGFAIDRPVLMAGHESWAKHGYPYMSGIAKYSQMFETPNDYNKLVLRFKNVSGLVRVKINDADVGVLHWSPFEMDITKYCGSVRNKLTVIVANTPDNLLRLSGKPSGLRGEVYVDVYQQA